MSGNFTQRGETSLLNKWEKANLAIENGIDLVLELPTIYSISSSENFSYGAIKILDSLKTVDYLSFGVETNNLEKLENITNCLLNETPEFKNTLKSELSKHISYPKALENAIIEELGNDYQNILTPNNTLGIEYIKSLKRLNSNISPIAIARIENNYNDTKITEISSATAIRKQINNLSAIKKAVPENTFKKLQENNIVPSLSSFENEILYNLRMMTEQDLNNLPDVTEELVQRIKQASNKSKTLDELVKNIKTKTYTQARIQRILLYILLKITKQDMEISKTLTPYARVLAFNKNGQELISKIKKQNPEINLITSITTFEKNCNNKNLLRLLEIDKNSTNIYTLKRKTNYQSNQDYTTKL